MNALLEIQGVRLDAIYYCPHAPEQGCACRKPQPGLAEMAARTFHFPLEHGWIIGDKPCDMELARACGARSILVRTGYGAQHELEGLSYDHVAGDLLEAAHLILRQSGHSSAKLASAGGIPMESAADRLRGHVEGSIETKRRLLAECEPDILAAARLLTRSLAQGKKILLCGNGGSAADCQHIAAEFVSVLTQQFLRPGLPAIALTTDSSILTASANDFGFEGIFARQLQALGSPGDVLLGISTSGNSRNVVRAIEYARKNGIHSVGLTGAAGGCLPALCDVCVRVPSEVTQFIQESHILLGHVLCDLAEQSLLASGHLRTVSPES